MIHILMYEDICGHAFELVLLKQQSYSKVSTANDLNTFKGVLT